MNSDSVNQAKILMRATVRSQLQQINKLESKTLERIWASADFRGNLS